MEENNGTFGQEREKREQRNRQAGKNHVSKTSSLHPCLTLRGFQLLYHELESGVVLLSIIIGISLRDQQEENLLFLVQQQEIERILFVLSSALLSTSCSSNDRRSSGDSS